MSKQSFIYNSDDVNPNVNNPFTVEKSALIRAGGLTESVQVYFATGKCITCGVHDLIWEPLMVCGQPIMLTPENNHIVIPIPGRYSLGDPTDPILLAGNVNITKEETAGNWQLPKTCAPEEEPCILDDRGLLASW